MAGCAVDSGGTRYRPNGGRIGVAPLVLLGKTWGARCSGGTDCASGTSMRRLTKVLAVVAFFAITESCAPRYIPVHHYHEVERIKVERDSVYNSDTVRIAERGDTVLMEVVKWRTRYKTATDTLIRVDTVQLPPQLIAKSQEPRAKSRLLWSFAVIGLLAILYGVYRVLKIFKVIKL